MVKIQIEEPRVGWSELFYDLVIAASMLCITAGIAKSFSTGAFVWFGAVIATIFGIWMVMVLATNRRTDDTAITRILITIQMLALLFAVFSMDLVKVVNEDVGIDALGVVFLCLSVVWFRTRDRSSPRHLIPAFSCLAAGLVLLLAVAVSADYNQLLFYVGAAIGLLPVFCWYIPSGLAVDPHHYRERLGLLTILCLGEVFLEVVVYFHSGGQPRLLGMVLVFAIIAGLWWQYFPMISRLPVPTRGPALLGDMVGSLLVILGIVLGAFSLTEVALELKDAISPADVGIVIGCALAIVYAGLAIVMALAKASRPAIAILIAAAAASGVLAWATATQWTLTDLGTGAVYALLVIATVIATTAVNPEQRLRR